MESQEGLTMTHSKQIDTYRKICSQSTIQSDPKGQFSMIINQLREKSNYENALLQVSDVYFDQLSCKWVQWGFENQAPGLGEHPKSKLLLVWLVNYERAFEY